MPLVTIEGLDGAGKTTLAAGLAERLPDAVLLREPGGVAASERVRDLVKDPGLQIGPRAEALLYAAARAQLVEERLRPELDAGRLVLLDRFVDSSLAYQGAGRELGVAAIRAVNEFATGGLHPALTLLLRIDPAEGRARQADRGEEADRLEREADPFFSRIAAAYDELAAAEPERFRVLDARRPPAELVAEALDAMSGLA
jgi:dTMP kinase